MVGTPEIFTRGTVEREGAAGAAWLAELPSIVDELLARWECVPDGEVMHGGVGIIVPVLRRDAERAVLKVSFPHPGNVHEPDAFEAWGGRGAVLLHERDDERFAMLLERVRTSTLEEVRDGDEVVTVAGRLSRRLAVPAPAHLPRLRGQADSWEEQLRRDKSELVHTAPPYVVDAAVATVRELGRTQPDVLIHGDLHARNILRADREPWLAVDPKGYVGDPAYDGGTLLKTRAVPPRCRGPRQGGPPHPGPLRGGRGARSRTGPAMGPTPCGAGRVLGPPARLPGRPQRAGPRLDHGVRRPPGAVADAARPLGRGPRRRCGAGVATPLAPPAPFRTSPAHPLPWRPAGALSPGRTCGTRGRSYGRADPPAPSAGAAGAARTGVP